MGTGGMEARLPTATAKISRRNFSCRDFFAFLSGSEGSAVLHGPIAEMGIRNGRFFGEEDGERGLGRKLLFPALGAGCLARAATEFAVGFADGDALGDGEIAGATGEGFAVQAAHSASCCLRECHNRTGSVGC